MTEELAEANEHIKDRKEHAEKLLAHAEKQEAEIKRLEKKIWCQELLDGQITRAEKLLKELYLKKILSVHKKPKGNEVT
jgi:Flp pilus assembly protein TadD